MSILGSWGLHTQVQPRFGARAIVDRSGVSLLWDRSGVYGDADEQWLTDIDTVIPAFIDRLSTRRKFRGYNAECNEIFQPASLVWQVDQNCHSDKTANTQEYRFIRQVDFVIGLFALIRNLCQESDYPSFR